MKTASFPTASVARVPIAILGVAFDSVNTPEALAGIEAMIAARAPRYVVTANVDFLVQARGDVELRRILADAHMVLCDGTPLLWASRLLGNPLPERVAGADLVPQFIEIAARKGYRLFFLGATPESASQAAATLKSRYPGLQIEHYSPPFHPLLEMDHGEIRRRVTAVRPDVLLVSFGCPKQEKWIAMHYRSLGVPVAIGVGATIDFLSGQVRRAPRWMQRAGVEWVFRLAQEPRRLFRRYLKDLGVFGFSILSQWWRLGWKRAPFNSATDGIGSPGDAKEARIQRLPNRFDIEAVRATEFDHLADVEDDCILDMSAVQFIDSSGVGALIRLRKKLSAVDRRLILAAPGRFVSDALDLMRLRELFETAPDVASAVRLLAGAEPRGPVCHGMEAEGVLRWTGEVTAANVEATWELTSEFLRTHKAERQLAIDLSRVPFIDSSGLGLLLRVRKEAEKLGVEVHFKGAQAAVWNVLRIAKLERLFRGVSKRPASLAPGASLSHARMHS